MINIIKDVLSAIHNLYKSSVKRQNENFDLYITSVYNGVKSIYENYTDILTSLKCNVIFDKWKGKDSLKYLYQLEYEMKSERVYIREILKSINKIYDGEVERFINGVLGVMYCDYVDRFRIKEMEHRFSRLIRYAKSYDESTHFRREFLQEIDDMLQDITRAWEIVCSEYVELMQKVRRMNR